MPPPPDMPDNLKTLMSCMMATTYFFPLLKVTEILCGLLLLVGAFVPLALVILAPVVLNIFMVHLFMDHKGLPLAIFLVLCEVYLAFFASPYKEIVRQIFRCPMKEAMDAKKSQKA